MLKNLSLRTIKRICAPLVVIGLNDMTHMSLVAAQPIIQPGAPGSTPRELSAKQAIEIADTSYTAGDTQFMRDMIPHHQQALAMSRLAPSRTNSTAILDIAARIEAAQGDEIAFMEQWLTSRGETIDPPPSEHEHDTMRGITTPDKLKR